MWTIYYFGENAIFFLKSWVFAYDVQNMMMTHVGDSSTQMVQLLSFHLITMNEFKFLSFDLG
jgi:hypothetical protein